MKTVCTKCNSDEIFIVPRETEKLPETQTMDDFVKNMNASVPAIYIVTTMRCKKCGYEVNY